MYVPITAYTVTEIYDMM